MCRCRGSRRVVWRHCTEGQRPGWRGSDLWRRMLGSQCGCGAGQVSLWAAAEGVDHVPSAESGPNLPRCVNADGCLTAEVCWTQSAVMAPCA